MWLVAVAGAIIASRPACAQATSPESTGSAAITFERTAHDFGKVLDTETLVTTFPFTNTGKGVLRIENVKASCGCTTPELPKTTFEPGESSQIEVRFNAKSGGDQSKNITVFTNDPSRPTIVLTISADVTQFLTTDPKRVRFDRVQKGQGDSMDIKLVTLDPDAIIERIRVTGKGAPWFAASLVPASDADADSTRVVKVDLLPGTPWGQHMATLNIQCIGQVSPGADAVTHTARITLSAKVIGTLHASSTMFRVGIVPPGETFTSVVKLIRTDGKPFEVLSATLSGSTVEDMAVKAVPIAKDNGGGCSIVLTGTPQDNEQRIGGEVRIFTDVPGEETLVIRIGGVARSRS